MLNIFKIYINNNNNLTDLYLFIKSKYFLDVLHESVDTLQSQYKFAKSFISSDLFKKVFKDDFSDLDIKFIEDFIVTFIL